MFGSGEAKVSFHGEIIAEVVHIALQNTTVGNRTPDEAERKLESVFEAVGEGQEGDEDIMVGLEVVS